MRKPQTVEALEKLGRVQLSKSFFMREFLYSEISQMGATACIIVTSFIPYYERTQDWTALAWWIHDCVPDYSNMTFFPKFAAFNISWHEDAKRAKFIYSYIKNPHTGKTGYLTKEGMDNYSGSHQEYYQEFIQEL